MPPHIFRVRFGIARERALNAPWLGRFCRKYFDFMMRSRMRMKKSWMNRWLSMLAGILVFFLLIFCSSSSAPVSGRFLYNSHPTVTTNVAKKLTNSFMRFRESRNGVCRWRNHSAVRCRLYFISGIQTLCATIRRRLLFPSFGIWMRTAKPRPRRAKRTRDGEHNETPSKNVSNLYATKKKEKNNRHFIV